MLLVKYEKFPLISKDDYIEELLFKYEKNVKHHQAFDSKGRTLLVAMSEAIDEQASPQAAMALLTGQYTDLLDLSTKLSMLLSNQEKVYTALAEGVNAKVRTEKAKLGEAYIFLREMARMHDQVKGDLANKVRVIEEGIPQAVFGGVAGADISEKLALMLDLWVYHNIVELK